MTDDSKAHGSSTRKGLSWVMVPFEAAKERIIHASMLAEQPYGTAATAWLELQNSAQKLGDGGRYEVSHVRIAHDHRTSVAAIEAIMAAFVKVGLIVDGRCATFILSRDQKHRAGRKSAAPAATPYIAADADAPLSRGLDDAATRAPDPSPPRRGDPQNQPMRVADPPEIDPSASRLHTESSESSSTTIDLPEDPPSSSSSPGEAARATTTTEGIFSKIVEAVDGRVGESVIRRDLPIVRKWIEAGYDLDGDILPELAEVAEKSTHPLRTLKARFIAEQLADRRARRLAAATANSATSAPATPAAGASPRAPPRFYPPDVDFNDLAEREIMGNG